MAEMTTVSFEAYVWEIIIIPSLPAPLGLGARDQLLEHLTA